MPKKELITDVRNIREKSPLIHNITNYVVMNNTANALLAIGASPVMAHAVQEVEQFARMASALVINVGTLSDRWVEAMELAMLAAREAGVPIIYDPVGAGATDYRDSVNERLLGAVNPTIIRGNGSEIMALARCMSPLTEKATAVDSLGGGTTKGVDSTIESGGALEAAKILSHRYGSVVVISGQTDYVVSGDGVMENHHGTSMMARVTGMGCTASAICGAFAAVNPDAAQAAFNAMSLMGIAGERASAVVRGTGSLQVAFLDELYKF